MGAERFRRAGQQSEKVQIAVEEHSGKTTNTAQVPAARRMMISDDSTSHLTNKGRSRTIVGMKAAAA